ncbi:Zinc finger protein Xfin [Papilio xuthus]|uniref:Zinc finger protein Xfin n=1 Tax=Papilio xuthus TaxID=66420 RepID=A0A0N1PFT1_PAPXU|nr:Zinc finger protein Xfin [Papilio xuthus]
MADANNIVCTNVSAWPMQYQDPEDRRQMELIQRTRPNKSELKYESLSPEEIKERKVRVDNKSVPKKGIELSKHRMNVREILINSNATPIRCFGGVGYACSFCTDEYPDPADLKNHTITSHKNISKFMKGKDLYRFLVKLDITNLKCKLCKSTIDDLEQLIDHLRSKHNKLIYDIKHQILPFKFDSETLRCFMCSNKFHKFKTLLEHMNVHYRNYICEVCDAGFVTRGIMINHSECHKLGSFACDYCSKVFDTIRKKKSHEKCVHIHSNLLNKCGYCNEKFSDYGKKQKHLKDAHDVPTRELKCEACEKSFVSQKQLSVHIKRVHLIERSHQCTDCDMTFFSSFEMRRHMLKHTGVRDFECSVCHKWYGRRRTLQEHMRIHADDRRFKCEYCGQAFVQKCSLRGHMRAKHGVTGLAKVKSRFVQNRNSAKPMLLKFTTRITPASSVSSKNLLTEAKKNQHNLSLILLNSNANPIRCKDSQGYGCAFCTKQFPQPTILKKHFLEEHNSDRFIKFMSSKVFENVVKLDITYLSCALCDTEFLQLNDFIKHLKSTHKKEVYEDVKSEILPFRFDTPELRCAICSTEYTTFKILQTHMNQHFSNYTCKICAGGFVTERLLQGHIKRHGNGEYKCTQCDKPFPTLKKREEHVQRVHLGLNKRNKCKHCDERFVDYWQKVNHMVKMHGEPPVVLKCQACERTFNNQRVLSRHHKKDHLLERRYPCLECDMKFFTRSALIKHMAKHTGLRQYTCDICHKSYGRKNTLREHLRIHADDRRYKCEYCGQGFVQKCSWRGVAGLVKIEKTGLNEDSTKPVESKVTRTKTTPVRRNRAITDAKKNKHNLSIILRNSNANPIRLKDDYGYGCMFCSKKFLQPPLLKKHFLEEHNNENLNKLICSSFNDIVIKLDITYLCCVLCDTEFNQLDDFTQHLKTTHKKNLYAGFKSEIIPFRFDTKELRCAICSAEFFTFKILQTHMNKHFCNYSCEICSEGFVSKHLLHGHVKRHGDGKHKCTQCEKTFTTINKRKEHVQRVHLGLNKRNKCNHCDERFGSFSLKTKHMLEIHGVSPAVLKCQACEKTFNNQTALTRHHKKDHLLERRHACTECDMKFFTSFDLVMHMPKHTKIRQNTCDICHKSYGRKTTLREHMRIHANDRRFKCENCGQGFVQKCSWRSHMRSKHGENV